MFNQSTNLENNYRKETFKDARKATDGNISMENSNVKAFTDNGDEEGLSINSDQNAYSESNRLRKITERYGYRDQKQPLDYNKYNPTNDYRFHQKT